MPRRSGRRAARRDRDARASRRACGGATSACALPGRAARVRRRPLRVQPDLRAGHDGRRRRGARAARLPGGRRARPRAALLRRRARPPSTTRGAWRPAPTSPCPRSRARARCGVRAVNAYLRRLRAVAEHDPAVAGAFIAVVGMREPPAHVLRPATALRVPARPAPRAPWRDPARRGVRRGELRVGDVTTPLREAGPAERARGGRVRPRQPRLERRLGAAARRRRRRAGAPSHGTRRASAARARPPASADRRRPRRVHRPRARRARHRARAPRAHDFGGPWGLALGGRRPGALRVAPCCSAPACCPATAGTRSRGSGARRCSASCSWPPRRGPASGCCCGAASRAALPRAFVDRMYDDFDRATRRAVLRLYRSVADVAAQASALAARAAPARPAGARALGRAATPTCAPRYAERQRAAFPHAEVRCSTAAATGRSSTSRQRSPRRSRRSSSGRLRPPRRWSASPP